MKVLFLHSSIEKSAAMEILKMQPEYTSQRKSAPKSSKVKALAGLAGLGAIAVLGSTLAANISLGSGSAIEFGQGVQVTSACDNLITLTPKAVFVNGSSPSFMLSTIAFSGVDASATTTCQGKTLSLNAYGDSSSTAIQLATAGISALTTATIGINSGTPTSAAGTVIGTVANAGTNNLGFELGFTIPTATSGAVYKLTLQSSN
jgi:hypothetical protein